MYRHIGPIVPLYLLHRHKIVSSVTRHPHVRDNTSIMRVKNMAYFFPPNLPKAVHCRRPERRLLEAYELYETGNAQSIDDRINSKSRKCQPNTKILVNKLVVPEV